jgi:hypothetical protein
MRIPWCVSLKRDRSLGRRSGRRVAIVASESDHRQRKLLDHRMNPGQIPHEDGFCARHCSGRNVVLKQAFIPAVLF